MKYNAIAALVFLFGCSTPTVKPSNAKPESDMIVKTTTSQVAVFAGGCFWCTEAAFEQLKGVLDVVSGYAGDSKETADYETTSTGDTKHAESVRVSYEPSQISYEDLLRAFFVMHDPTTKNRQGNDIGPQYRSTIFYLNQEQKTAAEAYIAKLTEQKKFSSPIVTTLEPLKIEEFYLAEKYHQDYIKHNPNQPYVVNVSIPKVEKVRKECSDLLKP